MSARGRPEEDCSPGAPLRPPRGVQEEALYSGYRGSGGGLMGSGAEPPPAVKRPGAESAGVRAGLARVAGRRPGERVYLRVGSRMGAYDEKKETCGTICLKYLLFTFNFLFWLAGGAVMAVGIWTLVEKSDYISLLQSSTYTASAYILVLAGVIVMITGVLGCCATFKEQRNLLRVYFVLLLCIFLLEILAGVLAYIYYQQLNEELKQNLKETMVQKYKQSGQDHITRAVDKLQQEFKCCGSNSSLDWSDSIWIKSPESDTRKVPDSCCKTPTDHCGLRDHPSNIYKVEGGCITKLENFILEHLKIIGAVGIGIACVQIVGMVVTCCLYRSLKAEPY
ncbi:CD151 antigen [Arapaima gigas]